MPLSTSLRRLLLIRDHEWALVSRMFAFEFFQGASIAIFFTSSVTLFLDRVPDPIGELPKVFILSAFLLWFFGWVYSRLEHLLSVKQITLAVLIFNALSILSFRIFNFYSEPWWFYYMMLAWFNVAYLLNNLEFWGLASRLFDVRQSRRLFAIVSAGDIPAKFIGYVAAIVVIPIIGSQELLWIAAASSLLSLLFFHRLISLDAFQFELRQLHGDHHNPKAKDLYNLIAGNKLIQQVALISFFTLCCFLIVNFVFYGYIKEEFHQDKTLATFIAMFLAASRGITLVIKLLFTNRIADRYGIKGSLLITPIVIAVFCILSLMPSIFGSVHAEFYLFGMMAIMTDVLRSAIQSPVLLSTMQPLPLHQRLQGHTIMKGVMDPFAYFVVGVLLLVLYHFDTRIDLRILSSVIMVLLVMWIAWIFSADHNYIQTLTAAIRNRALSGREIEITNQESLEVMRRKISGESDEEAVFVFHLLKDQDLHEATDLIRLGLKHKSATVRLEALKLVKHLSREEASACLHQVLNEEIDSRVKAEAVQLLPEVESVVDFTPFLTSDDPVIACSAITGIFNSGVLSFRNAAEEKLKRLVESENILERKSAAKTLGEIRDEAYQPQLISLLYDNNAEVSNEAMLAASKLKSPQLISVLLNSFSGKNKSNVFRVLEACGSSAIPLINNFIRSNRHSEYTPKMISILGKIGGGAAQQTLDHLIDELPQHQSSIIHALYLSGYTAPNALHNKYHGILRQHLNEAVQIAFMIRFLQLHQEDTLLADALNLELFSIRDQLLETFSMVYDAHRIKRAAIGLKMNTRDSVPNALELVDLLVAKEFSQPFICLYEHSGMERKCADLKQHYNEPHLSLQIIRNNILHERSHNYFPWTKSCVIYEMTKANESIDAGLLEPFKYSPNKLLSETATFAFSGNTGSLLQKE